MTPDSKKGRSLDIVSSVVQSCATLCDPMDCSTPGFPVHHQLLELAQTQVHRVGDAIQPSLPLLSPSQDLDDAPKELGAGVREKEFGKKREANVPEVWD